MHARDLVELAALVTTHGSTLLSAPERLTSEIIARYAAATQTRFEDWSANFARWQRHGADESATDTINRVCEEILTSDVLVRVWSTVVASCAKPHGLFEPKLQIERLFAEHQLVCHDVYLALLDDTLVRPHDAMSLNRLRRRAEGWSDVLVGHLVSVGATEQFAPHPERARQFATEQAEEKSDQPQAWKLVLASLRLAFRPLAGNAPNADANEEIANAILSAFDRSTIESASAFPSLWRSKLTSLSGMPNGTPLDSDSIPPVDAASAFLMSGRWDSMRP